MFACAWFTIEASMGRKRVVVAVLLEHSVKVATSRESIIEMAKGGMLCRGAKLSPSHLDKPDTWKHWNWKYMSATTERVQKESVQTVARLTVIISDSTSKSARSSEQRLTVCSRYCD